MKDVISCDNCGMEYNGNNCPTCGPLNMMAQINGPTLCGPASDLSSINGGSDLLYKPKIKISTEINLDIGVQTFEAYYKKIGIR